LLLSLFLTVVTRLLYVVISPFLIFFAILIKPEIDFFRMKLKLLVFFFIITQEFNKSLFNLVHCLTVTNFIKELEREEKKKLPMVILSQCYLVSQHFPHHQSIKSNKSSKLSITNIITNGANENHIFLVDLKMGLNFLFLIFNL